MSSEEIGVAHQDYDVRGGGIGGSRAALGRAHHYLNVAFQQIRPLMPISRRVRYAGYTVNLPRRLGDAAFEKAAKWEDGEDRPAYESGVIAALEQRVRPGDDVVVVGGGWGVTAVESAMQGGEVVVYEGAADWVDKIESTARLNEVGDHISVEHAVVGEPVSLRGAASEADTLPVSELPTCDVLELDCEGAELEILQRLDQHPPTLIVETHGFLGSPTAAVRDQLEAMGYRIVSDTIAERDNVDEIAEQDVRVLTGVRE